MQLGDLNLLAVRQTLVNDLKMERRGPPKRGNPLCVHGGAVLPGRCRLTSNSGEWTGVHRVPSRVWLMMPTSGVHV